MYIYVHACVYMCTHVQMRIHFAEDALLVQKKNGESPLLEKEELQGLQWETETTSRAKLQLYIFYIDMPGAKFNL